MGDYSRVRTLKLAQKRESRFFAAEILEGTVANNGEIPADKVNNYHLGNLPERALIIGASVFVKGASDSTTKTGTLKAGTTAISSAADLTLAGPQGTFTAQLDTGTGKELWLDIANGSADGTAIGAYLVFVEYLEYDKTDGEYTSMVESATTGGAVE